MIRLLRYGIFLVILSACTHHLHVSEVKTSHYEVKTSKNDSITNLSVLPYKEKLDKEMNQVIAYSDSALTREGREPLVGNFVMQAMDVYVTMANPRSRNEFILLMNYGGLRNALPSGNITKQNIFELMPFDNELVIIDISGAKLKECIFYMARSGKLLSVEIGFTLTDTIISEIKIGKKDFNENQNYRIVTTDYIANGGDNCTFFKDPLKYETANFKLRDAILYYCEWLTKKNIHIKPLRLGRVKISK